MKTAHLNRVLAENIRHRRREAGLSQEQLAARCHVHRTYLGGVERGERNVTLNTVERIAAALGVDALDLLRSRRG